MQKSFALLAFLLSVTWAFGQTPFTITSGNFPVFTPQTLNGPISPAGPNFIPSGASSWDYSAYHSATNSVNEYVVETDPFYTNQGIDVYILTSKSLTPSLGYSVYHEFDFNNTGVYEDAIYVPEQGYGLSAFTGNTADSITFPLQGSFFQGGRKIMQFPAAYHAAWTSVSHRSNDFYLTVNAAGLVKVPSQHRYTVYREDTIIGAGTMRVYSGGIPSIPYPVLIDRSKQYSIDSFYVGGAPAPAQLMAAFGISQGMQASVNNRYTAYREGNSAPLAIIYYAANNFTTPSQLYFDTENLATSDVETPAHDSYSTLLFPNPGTGSTITLQVMGDLPALSTYTITDQSGRTVQTGTAQLQGGAMQIQLNQQLPYGNYILQVMDKQHTPLITEQFIHGQ